MCSRKPKSDCGNGAGLFCEYKPGETTHYVVNGRSTASEHAFAGSAAPQASVEWPGLPWYRDTTVIGLLAGVGAASALPLGIVVVIWRRDRTTSWSTGAPSIVWVQGK